MYSNEKNQTHVIPNISIQTKKELLWPGYVVSWSSPLGSAPRTGFDIDPHLSSGCPLIFTSFYNMVYNQSATFIPDEVK